MTTCKWLLLLAASLLLAGTVYATSTIYQLQQDNAELAARVAGLEAQADPEAEYYRGIYDMWRYFEHSTGREVDALELTGISVERGWYGQPSSGWRWPVD